LSELYITLTGWQTIKEIGGEERHTVINTLTLPNPKYKNAIKYGGRWATPPKHLLFYNEKDKRLQIPLNYKIEGNFRDSRITADIDIPVLSISLRDYQNKAVDYLYNKKGGLLQAKCGAGKTVMALALAHKLQQRTLILVHTNELLHQWKKNIKELFGVNSGQINGEAPHTIGKYFTIANTASLIRRKGERSDKAESTLRRVSETHGLLICDECHHAPCESMFDVVSSIPAKYRYGLSATPTRADGLTPVLGWLFGDSYAIPNQDIAKFSIVPTIYRINTDFSYNSGEYTAHLTEQANDPTRNSFLADFIHDNIGNDKGIVMCERVEQIKQLTNQLQKKGIGVDLYIADTKVDERKRIVQRLQKGEIQLILGTSVMFSEGFDCPSISKLFLVSMFKDKSRTEQTVGRIMRIHEGKDSAEVYDFVDEDGRAKRAWYERLKVYKAKNWKIG